MDYEEDRCFRFVFSSFVCLSLSVLLGMQVYSYVWGSPDVLNGDFSDIKYVVMQLTRGLSEVNSKHEHLKAEMERISSAPPAGAATPAAGHVQEALLTASRCCSKQSLGLAELHDYDRQIADYALESAGARIMDTGATKEHVLYESPVGYALHALTALVCRGHECSGARAMLRPGALPGECWAFKGSKGEAIVRLLGTIHVTGVSLEHISAHISPTREISSAPRVFAVEGLEHRSDTYFHDFGTFEYDKGGKPIQYFQVRNETPKGFNLVRLRILANWGHPVYTCVYRFRVHGELVSGQLPWSSDDDLRIENE